MLTPQEISSEESEDPDITSASARQREIWLEKRAAKVGRKSVAWFQRIGRHKRLSVQDIIEDELEPIWYSEFSYYKWNVGVILCYLCNKRLTKKTITKDHVFPQSKGGGNEQDNVMPCCADCNHDKADQSLASYMLGRTQVELGKAV